MWPDTAALERLDQVAKQLHALCGGRRTRRETIHMTLAFIGEVPLARVEILRQAAGRVAGAAFTLRLDRLDCWRHNRVAWAGCSEPPLHLVTLVGQLSERLADAGLPLDIHDFAAHVTLLRNVSCVPMPDFEPINWPVADFVLVESQPSAAGPHYAIIGRWPLIGAAADVPDGAWISS